MRAAVVRGTREAIPFFALYALFMREHGLGPSEFAAALLVWSLTGFVLEVPSGALADRVDRRRLLFVSGVLYLGTFVTWLVLPTFPGFLLGFVLWGVSTALESGTFEALLHDELTARGCPQEYGRVRSRSEAVAVTVMALAIGAGGPLHALGGYRLAGVVSVAMVVVHCGCIFLLPWAPIATWVEDDEIDPAAGSYAATLRAGVSEAARNVAVRRAIAAYVMVIVVVGIDEYVPNLLQDNSNGITAISYLLAVMVGAQALGTAGAHRLAHAASRWLAPAAAVAGAAVIGLGALVGGVALPVGMIAGYGLVTAYMTAMDIRLQDAIVGPSRATVTSVGGFANEIGSLASFGAFGWAATAYGWRTGAALVCLVVLLPLGVVAARSRPTPSVQPLP